MKRHGFSIPEMCVVMAVLVLLAILSVQAATALRNSGEFSAVRRVVRGALMEARATSIADSQPCEVDMSSKDSIRVVCAVRYVPDGVHTPDNPIPGCVWNKTDAVFVRTQAQVYPLPPGMVVESSSPKFQFLPDGSCSNAEISLRSSRTGRVSRLVLKRNGRVDG